MALNPDDLAMKIVSDTQNMSDSSQFMQTLGHTIAKYLCENTEVVFAWVGIQPGSPPVPDSTVSYTTDKITGDFILFPTGSKDPIEHNLELGKQITNGIKTFIVNPAEGWIVPPIPFLAATPIPLTPTGATKALDHWKAQSAVIIATYLTYLNPTPLLGAHGAFLAPPGTGAVMTLIS